MTKKRRQWFAIVFGFVLAMVGLAAITSGLVIAHTERSDVHWAHIILGFALLYIGGRLMSPTMVDALADAVINRLTVLLPIIPGGRRSTDPPLPPSVDRPTDTKPTDVEGA